MSIARRVAITQARNGGRLGDRHEGPCVHHDGSLIFESDSTSECGGDVANRLIE